MPITHILTISSSPGSGVTRSGRVDTPKAPFVGSHLTSIRKVSTSSDGLALPILLSRCSAAKIRSFGFRFGPDPALCEQRVSTNETVTVPPIRGTLGLF